MARPRLFVVFGAFLFVSLGLEVVPAAARRATELQQPLPGQPIVREAVAHDTSPPLRDLPPAAIPQEATNVPPLSFPDAPDVSQVLDPALQTESSQAAAPPPNQTFAGNGNNENSPLQVNPPDTVGDVGPNHYVQMVNLVFSVYSKSGNRLLGPLNNNTLWLGMPGVACPVHNWGDPIVLYDQFADRWLLSQFAFARDPAATGRAVPPFFECVAISATPDPTGAYHRYEFLIDDTLFNDYPKFGVWPDAYYMSVNQFQTAGASTTYAGPGAVAFERDRMLNGLSARMVYFDLSTTLGTPYRSQLPSDADGMTPPPPGSPNYFIEADDREINPATFAQDQLSLFEFHVDWTNPASSTFGANAANAPNAIIPTAPFDSTPCATPPRQCVPQKGTTIPTDNVDTLGGRLMHRAQYRNFGTHEVMVVNDTVDVGDVANHAGIRWYELRDPGGTPTIAQQSTYAPDAEHRFMGSIAMDGAGNMALGYSLSSADRFPSINYTGRLSTDPPNTMQDEALMFAGTGSQLASGNRWGDYSSMNVDPTDDCTFWYTQEFYPTTATFGWRTRIGSFRFPLCGDLALVMSDSPDPVEARSDLTYTARVLAGATDVTGVTFTDPLPSGVTFVSATPSHGTCTGGSTLSCNLGDLSAGVVASIDIVVRTAGPATLTNTASITSTSPDAQLANNTVSVVTAVEDRCFQPGLTMITDPTGDATGAQPFHDIQRVSVAEPFLGDGVNKVFFTLKMAGLSNLPPSSTWPVTFLDQAGTARFVAMKTDPAGAVRFVFGTGRTAQTEGGTLDPASNFNSNGTITLVALPSQIGNPAPGQTLTGFLTRVRSPDGGSNTATPDNAPGDLNPIGSYTLAGNDFCKPLDLSVDKTGPTSPAPTGRTMTYTVDVTNNGPGTATGVLFTDTLPGSVTFVSARATQGSCSGTATVTCLLGTITAGSTVTVTIQVTPRQAGAITNSATAVAHEVDSATGNNTDTVMTSICRVTSRRSSIPCGFSGSVAEMRNREAQVGARHGITWVFQFFNSNWPGNDLLGHLADGRTVIANLGSQVSRGGYTWQQIAAGQGEARIREIARVLRELDARYPDQVLFSFSQEPETEVEQGQDGNTPEYFRPAWRRVHGYFRSEGFQGRFIVVTGSADQSEFWTTYYPGHPYVDVIGVDEFTWPWDPGTNTFESEYARSKAAIEVHAPGKPWMASSTGMAASHGDGRRISFIRGMVAPVERWAQDPTEPLVGVVWWDRGMFVLTPGVFRAWRDTVQAVQILAKIGS